MTKKIVVLVIFSFILFFPSPSTAQAPSCGSGTAKGLNGLVTAPDVTGFNTTGGCVEDSKTSFDPSCPTCNYLALQSYYFNQSKSPSKNPTSISSFPSNFNSDGVYITSGNFIASGSPTSPACPTTSTEVIFVPGNLDINANLVYHTPGSANDGCGGLVFIVRDNVNIASTVTQIDAVIISQGIIYTANAGCSTSLSNNAPALTINGSLISLNKNDSVPIKFCRSLANNNQPAEIINHQPKYLVLLRNLIFDNFQRWSEIQ